MTSNSKKKPKISYSKLDQQGNFKVSDNAVRAVKISSKILGSVMDRRKKKA